MNDYPPDWEKRAQAVKDRAGWRCIRCGHPHEYPAQRIQCDEHCDPDRHPGGLNDGRQRVLTVHHLDGDKANCKWWNLLALCQVCHLQIQAKIDLNRPWLMLDHSEWFLPYVAGWYAWRYLKIHMRRQQIEQHLEYFLSLEREYFNGWPGCNATA